jgi:uncharacterized damage-inducible protein DinB
MDAIDLILCLHHHRVWVNQQLLAAAEKLSDPQLRQNFPIGQGSIWKSLLHLYAADYIWLEALLGDENPTAPGDLPCRLPGNQQGQNPMTSLSDLKQKWTALMDRWTIYLQQLVPESLDDLVYKISTSSHFGQRRPTRRCDILLHICTHAQYTTAQILNMLRHFGLKELPDPMLITLARQQCAKL